MTAPTVLDLVQHGHDQLDLATTEFKGTPSAAAYIKLMTAALVYQQARNLRRLANIWSADDCPQRRLASPTDPDERLERALAMAADDPLRTHWNSIIVECACARSIADVLNDHIA